MTPNHDAELNELCDVARESDVLTYLEIGSRNGVSLAKIGPVLAANAARLGRPARIIAIDLANGPWGSPGTGDKLNDMAQMLRTAGIETEIIFGDSTDPGIVSRVQSLGPFDMTYVDGDHRYKGVSTDWENYGLKLSPGLRSRIVALDDVLYRDDGADPEPGVWRLWGEIKSAGVYETRLIAAASSGQGIGVITEKNENQGGDSHDDGTI